MKQLFLDRWPLLRLTIGILTLVLLARTSGIQAQGPPPANLRNLNEQLLNVYARLLAVPDHAGEARRQAAVIMQQRINALASLIQQNPSEALALAFNDDLLSEIAAAFPESSA